MRFAYNIDKINSTQSLVTLFNAADAGDELAKIPLLVMEHKRSSPNEPWKLAGITLSGLSDEHSRLIRNFKKAAGALDSPIKTLISLHENVGARQVVYDARLKKFRNVTTMKEGEDTYSAKGIKGINVTAKTEEEAVNRVKKVVTDAMMTNPSAAAELSAWFTAGCKVDKLASGKLPDVLKREELAGPGEAEIAKKGATIVPSKLKKAKEDKGSTTKRHAKNG